MATLTLVFLTLSLPLTLSVNVTCEKGLYPPPAGSGVETYVINLDLPPEQRWEQVVSKKIPQLKALLAKLRDTIAEWGPEVKQAFDWIESNIGELDSFFQTPFKEELLGMAKSSGMTLNDVVLYNLFYELTSFCTSIVAQDTNGKLYHARNMDYEFGEGYDLKNKTWFLPEMLRPLLVNLEYHRGGDLVFKSVNYVGYLGVVTGIRPKSFTVSINARGGKDGGGIAGILQWLLGMRNGTSIGFLTRSVLENATSFSEARTLLSNTPILAPVYYILGGKSPGEGCVITRDRDAPADVWPMQQAGGWYVLETNYDHWEQPTIFDDRRGPANQCMKEMSQQHVSIPGLFNVLSTKPVLNKGTVFTALMQVDSGHLETWIQDCKDPCPPW